MTITHYILLVLIASFMGSLFHVWKGGNGGKLILFITVSIVGVLSGQLLFLFWPIKFFEVGPMKIGLGIITSILFLFGSLWLSNFDTSETDEF